MNHSAPIPSGEPLRVVVVDDEPLAVRSLERALSSLPAARLVGSAPHGQAGLALIREARPDVVLLDIKMPEMGGLELAETLAEGGAPVIIFVTAFQEFALEAFAVAAVDYLLKPVEPARLAEAIERARTRVRQSTAEQRAGALQQLVASLQGETPADLVGPAIWVAGPRGRQRLPLTDIAWFEAQRDYVRIHAGGRSFMQRGTLRDLAAKLDGGMFQRVHRSAIVNLNAVAGIERRNWGQYGLRLKDGVEVPIGRAWMPELRAAVARAGVVHVRG